jgi:hypothetical protein
VDLIAVSEEIRTALAAITGLRRPPWGVQKISPPAALVALPQRIILTSSYGSGFAEYDDLPVIIIGGDPNLWQTTRTLAAYVKGSGPQSVKATLEPYAWTTCDSVAVQWAEFDEMKYAGVDYLGVIFHNKITGKGTI